jgi:hypothetical protein
VTDEYILTKELTVLVIMGWAWDVREEDEQRMDLRLLAQ